MSTSNKNKRVMGRGLDELLGADAALSSGASSFDNISIQAIRPNKEQPRQDFDQERLQELADSIRELGLIQPITVQRLEDESYMIVAGERRWRAAQMAGLTQLPAYIREVQQEEVLQLALVENVQREDLNAIEIALAYQQLLATSGLKQEQLAERVGKNRATISNYLRLLRLPAEIQLGLKQKLIDMGHARALLQVEDMERLIELYHLILQEQLSVRAVEELARAIKEESLHAAPEQAAPEKKPRAQSAPNQTFRLLEQHLTQLFSAKVALRRSASGKGKLTIPFDNDDELERIMQILERLQQ